ncbi:MAG TPA: patatin-like phospholipase family protein [Stellaceae bacterium]
MSDLAPPIAAAIDAGAPPAYRIPLPTPSIFDGVEAHARAALEAELEWFSLPGGRVLFEANDQPDGLYLVLSGRLAVIVRTAAGQAQLLAEVAAGETVGDLALLAQSAQPATVIALRDTSLVRLDKAAFERLMAQHPSLLLPLTLRVIRRLQRALSTRRDACAPPKTVAMIPLDVDIPVTALADALGEALNAAGLRATVLGPSAEGQIEDMFYTIESAHDVVIYRAEPRGSPWTQLCVRRSDRVLLVAGSKASPVECLRRLVAAIAEVPWRRAELVLLHGAGSRLPVPADPWLNRLPVPFHCHIRPDSKEDIARLGRYLTGRAVGLVLSGGGARGYGHIGVIKALREVGIPIDLVGGTSIGSIMGASAALEWDDREFYERMHRAFVASNPLDDYALPLVALTRGRKVTQRLREHFGDARVEDLWRPYFAVATNLTTGAISVQRSGVLWRALRASIAIPGLLPPLVEGREVLVDGAVMNNLPSDIMSAMRRGPVIGVDVTRYQSLTAKEGNGHWSLRHLVAGADYDGPGIVSLLLRAGTMGGDAQTMLSRAHADVLLEPPLQHVSIRDWRDFDRTIEAGYRYTMEHMGQIEAMARGEQAAAMAVV